MEELIKERNKLVSSIKNFEIKNFNTSKKGSVESMVFMNPSPDVVYKCKNLYLIEITELINKKIEEINFIERLSK